MNSECRPRTTNRSSLVSIVSSESVLVRKIDPICVVGKIDRAWLLDLDAQHSVANPDLQVRSHEHRALIGFGDELDVLEDRLGAPGRNNPADHPERREQCLTVAQGPHSNPLISDCSRRGGREK